MAVTRSPFGFDLSVGVGSARNSTVMEREDIGALGELYYYSVLCALRAVIFRELRA
jgi:hypothetical protein